MCFALKVHRVVTIDMIVWNEKLTQCHYRKNWIDSNECKNFNQNLNGTDSAELNQCAVSGLSFILMD